VSLVLVMLIVGSAGGRAAARDPLDAMGVLRSAEVVVAPDPQFRALDGREVRVSQLRGRVVLVGFFTTW
jgi:cytochrome oxidase Cu insertion factor (SCO1/SenC/PrrC family)